jgi:hypothetical protein
MLIFFPRRCCRLWLALDASVSNFEVSSDAQVYMLFELDPAKELTGGPWYGPDAFDSEFITVLQEVRGG